MVESISRKVSAMPKRARLLAIVGATFLLIVAMSTVAPIPQDPRYHLFADRRSFLGIPNFFNVTSNGFLLLVGLLGVVSLRCQRAGTDYREKGGKWPYIAFFLGIGLTAIGSAYYHIAPRDATLFWDRLGMSMAFMSFTAAIISDRINAKVGLCLLFPLLIAGAAGAAYWLVSELKGAGDLRFYGAVQLFPALLIPIIMFLFPPRYSRGKDLIWVFFAYALAKGCEFLDAEIYAAGGLVSGHTLKHLCAAVAGFLVLQMLRRRQPLVFDASSAGP